MFTIVGFKYVISKKSGDKYVEFHLTCEDRYVTGLRVESVFVHTDRIKNLDLLETGSDARVCYNRYGRVESVEILL